MQIRISTDDLVSVYQAAEMLGRPKMTVYRWIHAGRLVTIKLGGIVYVPRSEVERLQKEDCRATDEGNK